METLTKTIDAHEIKPPLTSVGVIGWIRENLFNSVFNSILTLVTLFLLGKIVPPLVRWAFIDSVWVTSSQACQQAAGACWSIVSSNFRLFCSGFTPRSCSAPSRAMLILFGLLFYSRDRNTGKSLWVMPGSLGSF